MLRFPPGLRDRVKTAAERSGRSMNEEIIRTLEKEYPEPWPLNTRVSDLLGLVAAMKEVRGDELVDRLTAELLVTIEGIASGRVQDVSEEERERVRERLEDFMRAQAKDESERSHWYEANDK